MKRVLAAAILGGFFFACNPASAQEQGCTNEASLVLQMSANYPGSTVAKYEGPAAHDFLARLSEVIRQASPEGDSVLVFTNPKFDVAYIVVFRDGCAKEHGNLPLTLLHKIAGEA